MRIALVSPAPGSTDRELASVRVHGLQVVMLRPAEAASTLVPERPGNVAATHDKLLTRHVLCRTRLPHPDTLREAVTELERLARGMPRGASATPALHLS
jgi:hypothetical protein